MKLRKSTVDWEKDVYAQGKQVNHWPYSEVVSAVLRSTANYDRQKLKLLEIGCGTGNNLWFALESGFQVAGIDMSPTAVTYARNRLIEKGFSAIDLRVGDLTNLPWEDDQFDIVIDRGALTQNDYTGISIALKELLRVMKPGGKLFSFDLFGLSTPDKNFGREVSLNTFDNFSDGRFANVGLTSFFDAKALAELFKIFRDVSIERQLTEDVDGQILSETFSVSCIK